MARHREVGEADLFHDSDHIVRHSSLAVWSMIRFRWGTSATTVSTKIRTNHRKLLRQQRPYITPHQMCLWKTMEKKNTWPRAKSAQENARIRSLNFNCFEILPCHRHDTNNFDLAAAVS